MWRTVYLAALIGVGCSLLALAAYAVQHRSGPGGRWFAASLFASAAWIGFSVVGLLGMPADAEYAVFAFEIAATTRIWIELLTFVTGIGAVGAWVLFVIHYTGRTDLFIRPVRAAIGGLVAVLAALVATTTQHGLVFEFDDPTAAVQSVEGLSIVEPEPGVLFGVAGAAMIAVLGLSVWLLLGLLWTNNRLFSRQALLVLVGSLAPVLFAVPWLVGWLSLPIVQIGFAVTCVCFAWALFVEDLLSLAPAASYVGSQNAVADLEDGILIAGSDGNVLRCNDAAMELLSAEDVVGEELTSILGPLDVDIERLPVDVSHAGRYLALSASPVTDEYDRRIGTTVTVRDVTDRRLREQRLQVLNRIVRHNLRNDLGVVSGFASMLTENPSADVESIAERIERKADGLVELSEKTRTIEQLFAAPAQPGRLSLDDRLSRMAARIKETYPDVDVTVTVDDARTEGKDDPPSHNEQIVTDLLAVEEALWALCENAAEYADSSDPKVTITGRRRAHEYEISVVDNGPGIPAAELSAIQSGTETPLEHGSGLGLWIAHWGVRRLDGELAFETDCDGTTATIRGPCLAAKDGLDPSAVSSTAIDTPLLTFGADEPAGVATPAAGDSTDAE